MTSSSHSTTLLSHAVKGGWFAVLARLCSNAFRSGSDSSADEQDRQRMRDLNAQAFTATEALLLTDYSPVSFVSCERCCGDHHHESR